MSKALMTLNLSEPERVESKRLRTILLHRVERLAEMRAHEGPYLEMRYQHIFGQLEVDLLQAQLERSQLQRELELLRAQRTSDPSARIDLQAIQEQMKPEIDAWQAQLAALKEQVESASSVKLDAKDELAENRARRIRKLYRRLLQQLHPDMHASRETSTYQRFWQRIQNAYESADLISLETFARLLRGQQLDVHSTPDDIKDISRRIEEHGRQIHILLQEWPFSIRQQLDDQRWIATHSQDLQARIAGNQSAIDTLKSIRGQLLALGDTSSAAHGG